MKEIRSSIDNLQQNTFDYWQTKLFEKLLWIVGFFGVPLLPIGAWFFLKNGRYYQAGLEVFFAVIILYTILSKKITVDQKKPLIIGLIYLVSVMILILTGPDGAGFVSIVLSLVLGGCILKRKQLIFISSINIGIFIILTLMIYLDFLDAYHISEYKSSWLINALVAQFAGLGLSAIISTIGRGLENQAVEVAKTRDAYERSVETNLEMVRNISDVIGIINTMGYFIYVSPNVDNIFSWKASEIVGRSVYDYTRGEDHNRIKQFYEKILETKEPKTIETYFENKLGDYIDIQVTAINLLENKSIEGILINFHDISSITETNRKLRLAKERAEVANHAKNNFLSSMSHELRTPLNGILGSMQLMELTETTEEQYEYISISKTSAKALADIIGDVLDYSKLDNHQMGVEKELFSLKELMDELYNEYKNILKEKQVVLNLNIASTLYEIIGDEVKIRRILMHLIDNAVKFTENGEINIEIDLMIENDTQVVEFIVSDTGIGIEENKFDHIFDYFSQVEATDTRTYGGSGLGLSICKRILDLLDGRIRLESQVGIGSKFIVRLPFLN